MKNQQPKVATRMVHHIKYRFPPKKNESDTAPTSPEKAFKSESPDGAEAGTVPHNAYHIGGDFRSGRWRQLRVMDRPGSQLLIRFTNCLSLRLESVSCNG